MVHPTSFIIVGGAGFRAQAFLRIAQAMPERFRVCGLVVRDPDKGAALEQQWHMPTYRALEPLLAKESPDFAVVSVRRDAAPDYIIRPLGTRDTRISGNAAGSGSRGLAPDA
jgi:predicted dehydrogenase